MASVASKEPAMLRNSKAFSSFAVRDLDAARRFYGQTLGVDVSDVPGMKGILQLNLAGGASVLVYPKPDHTPATFTVLNFPVENVERAHAALVERGVRFEVYEKGPVKTDAKGIASGGEGPRIAWFRDPSGNVLSILELK
jgi:catechol 2,3-dioxygenase-like lactoylglutathione lyase family enzyme